MVLEVVLVVLVVRLRYLVYHMEPLTSGHPHSLALKGFSLLRDWRTSHLGFPRIWGLDSHRVFSQVVYVDGDSLEDVDSQLVFHQEDFRHR